MRVPPARFELATSRFVAANSNPIELRRHRMAQFFNPPSPAGFGRTSLGGILYSLYGTLSPELVCGTYLSL